MFRAQFAIRIVGCSLALVAMCSGKSLATGFGPRVGITGDPDQVHMGLHVQAASMTPELTFVPSVELGVGSDREMVSVNFDIRYRFVTRSRWFPYVGGGPGVHFLNQDGNDNTDVGFSMLGGLQTRLQRTDFFTEMHLGLVDGPDFRFTVGWMFH